MAKREMVVAHVEKLLERITGNEKLNASADGEWPFTYETSNVIVRVMQGDDPLVFIFGAAALEVPDVPDVYKHLNDVNAKLRFARCYWQEGTVYIETELIGDTVDYEELGTFMNNVGSACDSFGPEIAASFGGHTHHEKPDPHPAPPPNDPDQPVGPYL